MVIDDKPRWLHLVFRWHGSILPRIWLRIAVTTFTALLVTILNESLNPEHKGLLTPLPFTLVGVALSIFLGFRNNTSYDRFWEGRKLWGRFVNTSRSLTRQILTLIYARVPEEEARVRELQKKMVYLVIAYIHSARLHLRDQRSPEDFESLAPFLPKDLLAKLPDQLNPPLMLLQHIGQHIQEAARQRWVDPLHVPLLEESLVHLTDIQGGCERIKSTPIPFSYTILIHRIVAVYCFGLPFGLVHDVGFYTPIVVLFVSYAFFGLDAIGDEIEEPFGEDINDLPLSALSRMVEINLRQALGESEIPPPLPPEDGVLR